MKKFILKGIIHRNKGTRRYCTIPAIFGLREWYKSRFNDLCMAHDYAYIARSGKLKADYKLVKGMAKRGYPVVAVLTGVFVLTVGTVYYYLVD